MSQPSSKTPSELAPTTDKTRVTRANRQNWLQPPYNRWSFQHVQNFTDTIRVSSENTAKTLPIGRQDLSGLAFYDGQGQTTTVAQQLELTYSDAFLVLHQGNIVTEQYFNGMHAASQHLIMSCSKSFTAALLGIAINKGWLCAHRVIEYYLPELKDSGFAGATVQQLLDMQVGLKFSENYNDLDADWRDCELATGWRESDVEYSGPKTMLSYAATLPSNGKQHGTQFHYQSIVTNMLGCALERSTGQRFAELFANHIWQPLGCEQDLVSICDSAGFASFEGGFNVCLRDFARFGQLIAQRGRFQNLQLIPSDWVENCYQPGSELISQFQHCEESAVLPQGAYHNQWWVAKAGSPTLLAWGIHGQFLYIDIDKNLVIAKMSSQPEADDLGMAKNQLLMFDAIANELHH